MHKLVIAGGGSASVLVAGHVIRSGILKPSEILVIEPSVRHFYQPGFTMIGGGLLGDRESTLRKSASLIQSTTSQMFHPDVKIIPKAVATFDPENNTISVDDGQKFQYENLVVAMGMKVNFAGIPGLLPALDSETSNVASIYSWDYAIKMNKIVSEFKGGNAIFCQPNQPMKCAGAPQKIMYLSHDRFTKAGIKANIQFFFPQPAIFSVPKYSAKLTEMAKGKGITLNPEHLLTKVDDSKKIAYFKNAKEEIAMSYDLLHVVPPHCPLDILKNSKIVDSAGFVDTNKETMQHAKYNNIWVLGDCSNLPTSKTMAAAISQANVLTHNYSNSLKNKPINAKYNGYTSCPIFVGQNKLMLCEFKYGLELDETFSKCQEKPHPFYYMIKRFVFPRVYFNLFKRGWWFGKTTIFKPKF